MYERCFSVPAEVGGGLATIQTHSSDLRLIHPDLPPNVFGGTKGEPSAELLTAAVVVSDVCE